MWDTIRVSRSYDSTTTAQQHNSTTAPQHHSNNSIDSGHILRTLIYHLSICQHRPLGTEPKRKCDNGRAKIERAYSVADRRGLSFVESFLP